MLHDGLFRGRADGGDFEMLEFRPRDAKLSNALPHCFHAIDAGKNEPVVRFDILQRFVEWEKRLRPADFDERDFDYARAQTAQTGGEASGLMAGAADQDAGSG